MLEGLATLLEQQGISYGAIEAEQLSRGSPLLGARDWVPQLAAVLALQREAGRRLFLVAATTESGAELEAVLAATGADRALVVCLRAPADVVAARVADREPDEWPGKQRLIEHARELAVSMPKLPAIDAVFDTSDLDPKAVAAAVQGAMRSRGLLS